MSWPRRSPPLPVQILLLLLVTLMVAQAVNAVVVLSAPPPETAYMGWVGEVADALAGRVASDGARFAVTLAGQPSYDNYEDLGKREFRDALPPLGR